MRSLLTVPGSGPGSDPEAENEDLDPKGEGKTAASTTTSYSKTKRSHDESRDTDLIERATDDKQVLLTYLRSMFVSVRSSG